MTLFIKGLIIGIGKILPGISGTVLAISLNEYKNIIYSFNNIFKKGNLLYLIKIGLGILISMIFMSKVLIYFINNYQTETVLLFVGLIMGTIPNIYSKVLNKDYIWTLVGIGLLMLIQSIKLTLNINITLKGFLIGIIEAITTIIPGISGTAVLSNLGLYNTYLTAWSNLFDFDAILTNINFFIPFIISLLITALILIKLIYKLLLKYEQQSNGMILGFVLASTYMLFKIISFEQLTLFKIIYYIIIIISGFIFGYLLDKKFK